ncbi:hypothetical protein AB0P17_36470 [Streptomyces sp. NPDC088124]|uniref:hypothetical protein n=1 Tax=Streptomyces sp. NPDC088124 TaxID=3154654 RepID=UPI003442EA47
MSTTLLTVAAVAGASAGLAGVLLMCVIAGIGWALRALCLGARAGLRALTSGKSI